MLIDPTRLTNFNRSDAELEGIALFSVLVAGKTALPTARSLATLLQMAIKRRASQTRSPRPFQLLEPFDLDQTSALLVEAHIGCHRLKGRAVWELVHSGIDLRTCTAAELEAIHGIGPKTARMFLLHTRPNQRIAALDVHILAYLRDLGHDVPRATPGSTRRYREIEAIALAQADAERLSPATWDLTVWNRYRRRNRAIREGE